MIPLSRPIIGEHERRAVDDVLKSGYLVSGPQVEAFESEFAAFQGVAHAVAVSNGTVALHLGLWALGLGPGDEVVLPSFTFAATANAVIMCGGTPVFADVDPDTYSMTAATIEPRLSSRTMAVIQVHLYGQAAHMDEVAALCARHGIALVEDAAQAHGARFSGVGVGGIGELGTFSFYPTKNMTTGEGGMVTTNSSGIADNVRLLRNHGMQERYRHEIVGTNGRMTDIAAAIGRVQLGRLPEWNELRRSNAELYDKSLDGLVSTPFVSPEATHVYHQYTIKCSNRATVTASLDQASIGYGIYYDPPCHRQKAFLSNQPGLDNTDFVAGQVLSIPVRPDLTPAEIQDVTDAIERGVTT